MKKLYGMQMPRKKRESAIYQKILQSDESSQKKVKLTANSQKNKEKLNQIFEGCSDIIMRSMRIFGLKDALILYVNGLVDINLINNVIIELLIQEKLHFDTNMPENIISTIQERIIAAGRIKTVQTMDETVKSILSGGTVLLIDGETTVLTVILGGGEKRNISEPITEVVIRGPRDGFTEDINTNISLLRKRLRTPGLKMETTTIGEISQTKVITAYLHDIAREDVIREVRDRLGRIKIDCVSQWKLLSKRWDDEVFPNVQVSVTTEIQLRMTGMSGTPIYLKESEVKKK